jgi:hypothetical protein
VLKSSASAGRQTSPPVSGVEITGKSRFPIQGNRSVTVYLDRAQPNRSVEVRILPLQLAQFRLMSYSELPVMCSRDGVFFALLQPKAQTLPGLTFLKKSPVILRYSNFHYTTIDLLVNNRLL